MVYLMIIYIILLYAIIVGQVLVILDLSWLNVPNKHRLINAFNAIQTYNKNNLMEILIYAYAKMVIMMIIKI